MEENLSAQAGTLEKPEDAGPGPDGVVSRWLMELELSTNTEKGWRESAQDALNRYRDEKDTGDASQRFSSANRFNILYSNVQTICPALYNQTPKPDVRRRFRDKDPMGKAISEVLERGVSYAIDAEDFDRCMKFAVKDTQIVGRGITRVKYEPTFGEDTDENGETFDALKFEEVCFEHVDWQDFRRGPGRTWEEVPWVAFKHMMSRSQLEEQFSEHVDDVAFDYTPRGVEEDDESQVADTFKRCIVWEIWDKDGKEVIFIAPSLKERPLKTEEDPLNLQHFFPVPRPLYATETSNTLVPIEPFRFYRDQAKELDEITKRISAIIKACKARGIYDASMQEMSNLMDSGENIMVPSENILNLVSQGGIERAIWMFPIEKIAGVLVHLYTQREQIKTTIYEITGIADIMRGSSAAQETLGAQQLKAQFGTMRLDDAKREVARYARDLVRIAAEIMAEKFSPQTLQIMTGLPVDEQMLQIMRIDAIRSYRIDVETDSTVAGDIATEQKNMTEMLGGIAQYLQAIGPAVEAGYIPADSAKSMLVGAVRRFKMGREIEDALEAISDPENQQQQGPSPEAMQAQQQMQEMGQMLQQLQQENEALKTDQAGKQEERFIQVEEKKKAFEQKDRELALKEQEAQIKAATIVDPQTQWEYDMAKERERMAFEAEQKERDRQTQIALALLSKGEEPMEAGSDGDEEMQAMAQSEAILQAITQALTAPKRVVYDEAGNVIGSETVIDG